MSIKCECGGDFIVDSSLVLTSMPPRYKASCKDCNHVEFLESPRIFYSSRIHDADIHTSFDDSCLSGFKTLNKAKDPQCGT